MSSINDAFESAILADAAYAIGGFSNGLTPTQLKAALINRMTPDLAEYIADNFRVVTSIDTNDDIFSIGSGFDAVVFQRLSDDKIYVAMRGTEGRLDFVTDFDLTVTGTATAQVIDMENWWSRITTPTDENAQQFQYDRFNGLPVIVTGSSSGTGKLVGVSSSNKRGQRQRRIAII